ncbi:erythroid differentiation-related factor 1-like [Rhopalosiphum maidis]|uniref:erythroid differentiation-related factor 1-like n=1 Tax=Rhopalosiphum maidis TaxID=43146 RepID=UPI000EFF2A56|nr:erythroid differentiation-related factor 1-like [Rhopalosiphum maidis]
MIKQNTQDSTLNDERVQFKSKAVVVVSTVRTPNFIHHKVNTNLNLKPQNFLSNEAESFGVRCVSGNFHGLSSFEMANMFLEDIGKLDVVSSAENIKNLCKLPYSKKSVSIMVHKIGNTLLFDEFDVEEHLTQDTSEKWAWLKKFFYNNIVKSSGTKVECITFKKNNSRKINHKNLVSKFLHHTIGLDSHNDLIKNICNETSQLASEEIFPGFPQIHRLFNRNVLWDFEDLRMLIGTNLTIFRNDNNSSLSTKLRDMSKSLSVLTGIDYWLENLMNDIPEIEFCYHINGIVQKYERVKTEDIPCLNGSTFSPNLINNNMQKLILFLRSSTIVGHTYWLFKGKNDTVQLYNLTILSSESLIDNPNPFIFPMASLFNRVAYKFKYNPENEKLYNSITIIHLLNSNLELLDKHKYPQVVTYVNCFLSDLYIAFGNNPSSSIKEELTNYNENPAIFHFDTAIASYDFVSEDSTSKHNLTAIKCFYEALYYIGDSLSRLLYFKNDKNIMVELGQISLSETRPIKYLVSEKIANNKNHTKGIRKKNQKPNKGKKILKKDDIESKSIPTNWNNPPNVKSNNLCNSGLKQMLYEKASRTYFNLADKWFACNNYGQALKNFRRSLECQLQIVHTEENLFKLILECCGNCSLSIVNSWDKIKQYISEFETDEMYDFKLRETLLHNSKNCTNKDLKAIPKKTIKSKECMLNTAKHCFLRALILETETEKKITLNKRLGIVYYQYTTFYMNEIINAIETNTPLTLIKLKWLQNQSELYFKLGSNIFKKQDDKINFNMIHQNLASFYQYIVLCLKKFQMPIKELIKEDNINSKVINIYTKLLLELGDRESDSELWDEFNYELFSILHCISNQNYSILSKNSSKSQQKCIKLYEEALKYCDLKNNTTRRTEYEFKSACIHFKLGSLFAINLDKYIHMKSPKVDSVLLQIESYYNTSFETFFKLNFPLDCLEVLLEMIKLDIRFIDGMYNWYIA